MPKVGNHLLKRSPFSLQSTRRRLLIQRLDLPGRSHCLAHFRQVSSAQCGPRVGIPNYHAYRSRDTFTVELVLAGAPLNYMPTLLGHQSVKITERHCAPRIHARQTPYGGRLKARIKPRSHIHRDLRTVSTVNQTGCQLAVDCGSRLLSVSLSKTQNLCARLPQLRCGSSGRRRHGCGISSLAAGLAVRLDGTAPEAPMPIAFPS